MMTQIGNSLIEAVKDEATKCIIIKAEGKVFSAGHDLRELVSFHIKFYSQHYFYTLDHAYIVLGVASSFHLRFHSIS